MPGLTNPIVGLSSPHAWQHIITTSLTAAAASVCFQRIAPQFRAFRLSIDARGVRPALRFNDDVGANYAQRQVAPNRSTVVGSRRTGQPWLVLPESGPDSLTVLIAKPGARSLAQVVAVVVAEGPMGRSTCPDEFTGEWDSDTLIHRIDVLATAGDFGPGTSVRLEGIRV
ncbi:MAG: hypothetical protein GEU80_12935 [Dehalococcoidia bacterium]|nr:hypothetical protein [Dehalococcoidia bacterium]